MDVRANGKVAFAGLTNPKQALADLPAGSARADVVPAGTTTVAIGPATLNLKEGTATIVYAVGSASAKTLTLVTQSIDGLHSAPSGVQAGTGGLLDTEHGTPGQVWAAAVAGVLTMLAGGFGPIVSVTGADGHLDHYRVVGRQEYPKTAAPLAALFTRTGAASHADHLRRLVQRLHRALPRQRRRHRRPRGIVLENGLLRMMSFPPTWSLATAGSRGPRYGHRHRFHSW